jgi:hypothetical protein
MRAFRFGAALPLATLLLLLLMLAPGMARVARADDTYLEYTRSYAQGYDGYYPSYAIHFAYGHGFVRIYYRSIYGYDFSVDSWQDCYWDANGCNKYVNGPAYHDWAHVTGASVFWSMHAGNHSTYVISSYFYYAGVPAMTANAPGPLPRTDGELGWCEDCR